MSKTYASKKKNIIARIRKTDFNFDEEGFKDKVETSYRIVQEARNTNDWESMQSVGSDELIEQQFQELRRVKKQYTEVHDIKNIDLVNYIVIENQEILVVYLTVQLVSHIKQSSIIKLKGLDKKTIYQQLVYRLEFVRTPGIKTNVGKSFRATNCLNCGAPINVASNEKCEYCHGALKRDAYDWVLNKYETWR